ncbi:MAG: DUF3540 domain-containing protein [Desulfococcaceae bacterium]|jgi:hypothetical protein|nr:DUF3540 domain-containing protein [Desulfococcaceae bacterium]
MKTNIIPFTCPSTECKMETAWVKGVSEDAIMIQTDSGVMKAGTAFSCLVLPETGDKVLLSRSHRECYVLAVLERPLGKDMALHFPASVSMKAEQGQMNMVSGKDMNLISGQKTRMLSAETHISSGEMHINAAKLTARTHEMESHAKQVRFFADAVDSVVKRITQRADTIMRWVEGVETLNIGSLIQNVRRSLTSRSHQAIISAKEDISINGERIHMG